MNNNAMTGLSVQLLVACHRGFPSLLDGRRNYWDSHLDFIDVVTHTHSLHFWCTWQHLIIQSLTMAVLLQIS